MFAPSLVDFVALRLAQFTNKIIRIRQLDILDAILSELAVAARRALRP